MQRIVWRSKSSSRIRPARLRDALSLLKQAIADNKNIGGGFVQGRRPISYDDDLLQRQKLEALGRFAGGMAHDFNNILSIIEGHTQSAVKKLRDGTLTPAQLEKILSSTQRGAGLTRQLLTFGRQKIDLDEKSDMRAALLKQKILLEPLLGAAINLVMDLPDRELWVQASEDQLTQIILNLALNARDAMPKGGKLHIICTTDNNYVRLTVGDTGGGIDPEILPRIFDPFFTTKEQGRGTGLGLAVVYGIVDQLNGRINVTSKRGEGTIFDVRLLQTQKPVDVGTAQNSNGVSLAGKTVLIAEDESELRDILGVMLHDFKMKVMTAANGNEAMEMQGIFKGKIDFLLTDVVMPEMDGLRLGKLFTVKRPDTNVVYMSGYPFMDGPGQQEAPASADFISKPLQEDTIRAVLERALQNRDKRLAEKTTEKDN